MTAGGEGWPSRRGGRSPGNPADGRRGRETGRLPRPRVRAVSRLHGSLRRLVDAGSVGDVTVAVRSGESRRAGGNECRTRSPRLEPDSGARGSRSALHRRRPGRNRAGDSRVPPSARRPGEPSGSSPSPRFGPTPPTRRPSRSESSSAGARRCRRCRRRADAGCDPPPGREFGGAEGFDPARQREAGVAATDREVPAPFRGRRRREGKPRPRPAGRRVSPRRRRAAEVPARPVPDRTPPGSRSGRPESAEGPVLGTRWRRTTGNASPAGTCG